jgi:hypothetical protein
MVTENIPMVGTRPAPTSDIGVPRASWSRNAGSALPKKFLKHFRRREAVKFNGFVPRFVAAHQFNAATCAIQFFNQQFD